MSSVEYLRGIPDDRGDIVDFANYVFSQAHAPHDFKKLLPKAYADNVPGFEDWHFLAKENGRIRAMVACMPMPLRVGKQTLRCGMVGTVSVHPYSRGQGHMKRLMADMLEDSRNKFDLLALNGQRQRYNYFGFDHAGASLYYNITVTGLRHCLGSDDVSDVVLTDLTADRPEELDFVRQMMARQAFCGERPADSLLPILHSWGGKVRLVRIGGEMAGYVAGPARELVLRNEAQLPRVLKALLDLDALKEVTLMVGPWEQERIRALSSLYEERRIAMTETVAVLHWIPVVQALLSLKADYTRLADGVCTLCIPETETFTIRVENGVPSVTQDDRIPDVTLSQLEAHRLLFGMEHALDEAAPLPASWLPLPFHLSGVDGF